MRATRPPKKTLPADPAFATDAAPVNCAGLDVLAPAVPVGATSVPSVDERAGKLDPIGATTVLEARIAVL